MDAGARAVAVPRPVVTAGVTGQSAKTASLAAVAATATIRTNPGVGAEPVAKPIAAARRVAVDRSEDPTFHPLGAEVALGPTVRGEGAMIGRLAVQKLPGPRA